MSFKDLITFRWLRDLFTPSRRAWINKMLPLAVSAAEVVTDIDWDRDGTVAGRDKLKLLLALAPDAARTWLADRGLYSAEGELFTVNVAAIEQMLVPHLKQTLAIVAFVTKLVGAGVSIPGWGIVETVTQLAYEKTLK